MMKKTLSILYVASLFACGQHQARHRTHRHVVDQDVKCYRQHVDNPDGSQSLIYWYLIWTMNNRSCYYYSSDVPVTSYSCVDWERAADSPIYGVPPEALETLPDQRVAQEDMSPDMQAEMNENADYFGGMTEEEMGDYEGGEADGNSEGGSQDGSGDGSSDGGSSDGGGDGGGGGD